MQMKYVPPSAADMLEKWYIEHPLDPPTKEEKIELISITYLDEVTIDNWFTMRRRRPEKLNNTDHLKSWLEGHLDNPIPSKEEKTQLASETGLSEQQVNSWLGDARRKRGIKRRLRFSQSAVAILNNWYDEHGTSPTETERC